MKTTSNGNIFRVTDPFVRGTTGHRWIPLTKASDAELWRFVLFEQTWTNGCTNNRDDSDLKRHRAHYDVTVMYGVSFVGSNPGLYSATVSAMVYVISHYSWSRYNGTWLYLIINTIPRNSGHTMLINEMITSWLNCFTHYWPFVRKINLMTSGFPSERINNTLKFSLL